MSLDRSKRHQTNRFYLIVIPGTTFGPPLCHFRCCSPREKGSRRPCSETCYHSLNMQSKYLLIMLLGIFGLYRLTSGREHNNQTGQRRRRQRRQKTKRTDNEQRTTTNGRQRQMAAATTRRQSRRRLTIATNMCMNNVYT